MCYLSLKRQLRLLSSPLVSLGITTFYQVTSYVIYCTRGWTQNVSGAVVIAASCGESFRQSEAAAGHRIATADASRSVLSAPSL